MNMKHRSKKGFTLIEVLISVTILVILIIPISSIIMTSMNKNKKSEKIQEASSKGQSVIEEFSAYDSLSLQQSALQADGTYKYSFKTLDDTEYKFSKNTDANGIVVYSSETEENGKYKYVMKLRKETADLYNPPNYEDKADNKNYYATLKFGKFNIYIEDCDGNKVETINYPEKRLDIWLDVSDSSNSITRMIISDFKGNEDTDDDTSELLFDSNKKALKEPYLGSALDVNNSKRKIKLIVDEDFKRTGLNQNSNLPVKIHCFGKLNLTEADKNNKKVISEITADIYSNKKTDYTILPSCLFEKMATIMENGTEVGEDSIPKNNYDTGVNVVQNKTNTNKTVPGDLCTMNLYVYDKKCNDTDINNGSAKPLFKGNMTNNINIIEKT